MDHILIIASDWLKRSLIGAQLREEGFQVTGAASFSDAVAEVVTLQIRPCLVIVESLGLNIDKEASHVLSKICGAVPLLMIHGVADQPPALEWDGKITALRKPVTVGQVVDKARELLTAGGK